MASTSNSDKTTMHNPNEIAPCESELINLSIDKQPLRASSLHPLALPTVTPLLYNIDPPSPPRFNLTLSAYHRSENAVRLTDACPNKLIHADYELLDPHSCRTLGHGASSTVRLAHHRRTGKSVAVKTIAKHDALGLCSKNRYGHGSSRKRIPRLEEVDVLTLLCGCDDVIQLLDVYETNTEVQLVLEYCEGGDLFDCIKKRRQRRLLDPSFLDHLGDFMEREASKVAKTLLGVLKTLHEKHCVHRDIKPENILLVKPDEVGSSLDVKLTDFGLAKILNRDEDLSSSSDAPESNTSSDRDFTRKQRSRAYSCVGSDFYTAPEVSIGLGYDTPVDIYSLGVTLFVMLCGTPPSISNFNYSNRSSSVDYDGDSSSDSEESSPRRSTVKPSLFPPELNISPLAQEFICRLIHPDPDRRITAANALKHQWITQFNDESFDVCEEVETSPVSKIGRSLSFAQAEALLKLPIQGSPHEIAPPVLPPSNSPKSSASPKYPSVPTPPPVSVTLASVCSKLAPLLDEQRHHSKYRRHRTSSKKHSRGADKSKFISHLSTPPKKVRMERQESSSNSNSGSCNRIRIVGNC